LSEFLQTLSHNSPLVTIATIRSLKGLLANGFFAHPGFILEKLLKKQVDNDGSSEELGLLALETALGCNDFAVEVAKSDKLFGLYASLLFCKLPSIPTLILQDLMKYEGTVITFVLYLLILTAFYSILAVVKGILIEKGLVSSLLKKVHLTTDVALQRLLMKVISSINRMYLLAC